MVACTAPVLGERRRRRDSPDVTWWNERSNLMEQVAGATQYDVVMENLNAS